MNIVLLSGGSGTRLWPLSNDVRSKQFLKLFKGMDNKYESMVQRVYQQIISADADANITIATNSSQVPAIRHQLGDAVSICIEPFRRDTFPAIVLAAAYLREEKQLSDDEIIIVCPVDPYVEEQYFRSIKKLEKIAAKGESNITLMGIEPTYPSNKYGYIIPASQEQISAVAEFKEKPSTRIAEEYITQGALWNAGVFAFKLGYLLDRAQMTLGFSDYSTILNNYGQLEKISFDYAVVEKEKSIQVLRYAGSWKDVGSWSAITEIIEDRTIGNAVSDDHCENVQIINELEIPILAMGLKNTIIVASNDGVLISSISNSDNIKKYAEELKGEARFAEQSWGTYKVIDMDCSQDGDLVSKTVKKLITAGSLTDYISYHKRDLVWTIISGSGTVIVDNENCSVIAGDSISINAGCKHMLIADTDVTLIETQTGRINEKDATIHALPFNVKDIIE